MSTMLRAGTGRAIITPPVGITHANWGAATHYTADGIHLDLWATALVVEAGETRICIIDLDLGGTDNDLAAALRQAAGEILGIPAAHVRVSCTHTHAGPSIRKVWTADGFELVEPYVANLTGLIMSAVRQAAANLQPARLAAGWGSCSLAVNRRLTVPGQSRVVVAENPDGFTDPAVGVVRIDDAEGRPLASLVHYSAHPITLAFQNHLISPDYPGVVKRVVEQAFGGTCLFLQGACGDQMMMGGITGNHPAAEHQGTVLGLEAAKVLHGLATRPVRRSFDRVVESGAPLGVYKEEPLPDAAPVLRALVKPVCLPLKDFGPAAAAVAEAERLQALLAGLKAKGAPEAEVLDASYRAKRALQWANHARRYEGRREVAFELQILRLNDVALVAIPWEPFAATAAAIKEASPFPVTLFSGYSNGTYGYIPTREEYARGGYECEWATPLSPDAEERLVQQVLAALGEV